MAVPTLTLNNGKRIPVIGLGTWQAPDEEVQQSVKYALDVGYRLIDTALLYDNEAGVGEAVRDRIDKGVITRDDVTVCSKLWNIHHSVSDVVPACRKSLKNLGLEFIDLYLIHWPMGLKSKQPPSIPQQFDSFDLTSIEDTWAQMERCVELGLVKSIGVSNFNSSQVQRVLDCGSIKPVVNQVECHMMLNQRPLIDFCKSVNVVVEGYSPFGSPSRPNVPTKAVNIFQEPKIQRVATKHGKTSGQIILRYLLQLGIVVLPKSVNPQRIKQNLEVFDFELSPNDVELLSTLDCHQRIFPFFAAKDHQDYPFPEEKPSSNSGDDIVQL